MYSINVVNTRFEKNYEFIGRPSPLGNPSPISQHKCRNEVCDEYEEYFNDRIHLNDVLILSELHRLHRLGKQKGSINLGCFCKQKHKEVRCHGDTIKKWIENNFDYLEMIEEMVS